MGRPRRGCARCSPATKCWTGAVCLPGGGSGAAGGPLLRRADLEALAAEVGEGEAARSRAAAELEQALAELAQAEAGYAAAVAAAERAREQALEAGSHQGDAARAAAHAHREAADALAQVERLSRRLAEVEERLTALRSEEHTS